MDHAASVSLLSKRPLSGHDSAGVGSEGGRQAEGQREPKDSEFELGPLDCYEGVFVKVGQNIFCLTV